MTTNITIYNVSTLGSSRRVEASHIVTFVVCVHSWVHQSLVFLFLALPRRHDCSSASVRKIVHASFSCTIHAAWIIALLLKKTHTHLHPEGSTWRNSAEFRQSFRISPSASAIQMWESKIRFIYLAGWLLDWPLACSEVCSHSCFRLWKTDFV